MSSDPMSVVAAAVNEAADERLRSRRQSLRDIGRFAAMTAPAMLVLLEGGVASASEDGGKGGGEDSWKSGDYNDHTRRHSHG